MTRTLVTDTLAEIARNFQALSAQSDTILDASSLIVECLKAGNKVIFCGNGGSAADSQHLAAELVGRFMKERAPLAGLALTVDTSALTAIGNDYGYDDVFSRQLGGLGRSGDVLVGLSTSGNSKNVLKAFTLAREMGIKTIGLTGQGKGAMEQLSDILIAVPSARTDHIQEMHIAIGHLLCGLAENALFDQ